MRLKELKACARCHGAHRDLKVTPFYYPIEVKFLGLIIYKAPMWASCPVTGEPILVRSVNQ